MTDRHKTHFSLNYLPLLIQLKCHETASLPDYMGSTLHGIMGWALLPHKDVYQYLFENRSFGGAKQDIINPYIIEPPASMEYIRLEKNCVSNLYCWEMPCSIVNR